MKKQIILLFIGCMIGGTFISCGSGDDVTGKKKNDLTKKERKLLGTWKLLRTKGNDIYPESLRELTNGPLRRMVRQPICKIRQIWIQIQ